MLDFQRKDVVHEANPMARRSLEPGSSAARPGDGFGFASYGIRVGFREPIGTLNPKP